MKQERNLFRKGTGTTASPLVVFSAAQQTRDTLEMELSGNRVEIVGSIDAPTTVTRTAEHKA